MRELLALQGNFKMVFVANDLMAAAASDGLRKSNRAVPDDGAAVLAWLRQDAIPEPNVLFASRLVVRESA